MNAPGKIFATVKSFVNGLPWPQIRNRAEAGDALLLPWVALTLLLFDRFGIQSRFHQYFGQTVFYQKLTSDDTELYAQAYFWAACIVFFAVLPAIFFTLLPANQGNRWGLKLPPRAAWPPYFLLIAVFLPVIFIAAGQAEFQDFYPILQPKKLSTLLLYEALYLSQFFLVEFFFRGPILFRLEAQFNIHAVLIMTVPYCWLHIHKPLAEAAGSIAAGVILGVFALKTRSIWPGFIIHCSVALAMDSFSLLRSGRWKIYF